MPSYGGPIDIRDISLHDLLWEKLREHGDETAIVDISGEERSITYSKILDMSRKCAAYLQSAGIKKGDFVSICSSKAIEFTIVTISILGAGAIVAPCNPSYRKNEILQQFTISRPRAVFVDEEAVATTESVKNSAPFLEMIFVIGRSTSYPTLDHIIMNGNPEDMKKVDVDPENDLAIVPHSSGTTGLPKCVMMTHRNYVSMVSRLFFASGKVREVLFHDRPIYHAGGFAVILANLVGRCKVIRKNVFEIDNVLMDIEKYKVTMIYFVPSTLMEMVNAENTKKYELSSLKRFYCGGATVAPDVIQRMIKKYGVEFTAGYGMTECLSVYRNVVPEDETSEIIRGKIQLGVEVKITDVKTGEECEIGSVGEIRIRSAQVMKGYLRNPSANAVAFDDDGWFKTGDLGFVDIQNRLAIIGRMKEIINYKTMQVSPTELESVIVRHAKVADVGVVGIPDAICGEVPRALVVPKDSSLTAEDIHKIVNENLTEYKHLRGGVKFVSFIPKSPTGKIQRELLKKM